MKLGDVIGGLGASSLAPVALVIAAAAFVVVVITTFLRRNSGPFEQARQLPLADEVTVAPIQSATRERRPATGRPDEPRSGDEASPQPDVTHIRAS
jgi:hypothetical protein